MLQDRNIDQFIMCVMFACNKCVKQPLSFRDIIDHYSDLNQYNKDEHEEIIHKIPTDKEPINLIKFYNSIFVPSLKDTISTISHTIKYLSL